MAALLLYAISWAGNNVLSIPTDLTATAGSLINVPIELTNEDEIVAAQFNVTLPFEKGSGNITLNTTRNINGHSINSRYLGSNKYTIVIVNMANKPIGGNSGVLLNIPMQVKNDAQPDAVYNISISDVVLTNRQGDNIQTGNTTGVLTITKKPSPDLRPIEVSIRETTAGPSEKITVEWKVENIGDADATAGWTEKVYLVNTATDERVYIGSGRSDAQLLPGGKISRSATMTLPQLIGQDEDLAAEVDVIGNSNLGEIIAQQNNNTARSEDFITLTKRLFLTADRSEMTEGSTNYIRMKLSRSGYWGLEETFNVSSLNTGLVSLPETVTIPQGQSGVYFNVRPVDNSEVNTTELETISIAAAHGYEGLSHDITVLDDEFMAMTLAFDKDEITEGESANLTVTLAKALDKEQTVTLSAELPKRFNFPGTVIVPAGEKSVTVQINTVDDDIADNTHTTAIYAVATNYNKSEALLILHDNDMPQIAFEFTPTTINENAGPMAIMAKLKRLSATNSAITVRLIDTSSGGLYMSTRSIKMDKGVEEAQFTIGAVDNGLVDGDRTVTVSAAVYVSSCSCDATGTLNGLCSQNITILDDDGPSLSMTTSETGIREGGSTGTALTVKRNTGTSGNLAVTLSCDDSRLVFPATITIPDGSDEATVNVTASGNDITGDTKTIIITATADGYTRGMGWLQIVDETLADAVITDFKISKSNPIALEEVDVEVTVENRGVLEMPHSSLIEFNLGGSYIDSLYTANSIPVNGSLVVKGKVQMPNKIQTGKLYAHINRDLRFQECLYINNESAKVDVNVLPPFTATVSVSKAVYGEEETVSITGQLNGTDIAGKTVEVYVMNEGRRQTLSPVTDETGAFTTNFTPSANQMGHFGVGACYPGENLNTYMTTFDILGLRRVNAQKGITHQLTTGQQLSANFVLYNPSNVPLHNVRVERISNFDDVEMNFSKIEVLEGGMQLPITYTLTGLVSHTDNAWHKEQLRVTSDEGAEFSMYIYYYSSSPYGVLKSDITNLKTTMVKDTTRIYNITLKNTGAGTTGKLSLYLPGEQTWMKAVTPTTMPALESGEETTISLSLTPSDDMQLNNPITGSIAINAENANGISIPFRITPVSGKNGILRVDVCDEFTYYDESEPHVAGAQVVVRNPTTNAHVTQGTTDENGIVEFDLPEGYYTLAVSADNHDSYTGTILVDPESTVTKVVNLQYQAIKISWEVVETEVEDVYDIKTVVTYETNVPKPVIEFIVPDSISQTEMQQNGAVMFHVVVTNKGLITAKNVNFCLGKIEGCGVEYFVENGFELPPGVSMVLPVRVYALDDVESAGAPKKDLHLIRPRNFPGFQTCVVNAMLDFAYACGGDEKNDYLSSRMKLKDCLETYMGWLVNMFPEGELDESFADVLTNIFGSGIPFYSAPKNDLTVKVEDCDPCLQKVKSDLSKDAYCKYSNLCMANVTNGMIATTAFSIANSGRCTMDRKPCPKSYPGNDCMPDWNRMMKGKWDDIKNRLENRSSKKRFTSASSQVSDKSVTASAVKMRVYPTYIENMYEALKLMEACDSANVDIVRHFFGGDCWTQVSVGDWDTFTPKMMGFLNNEITIDEAILFRPSNVSEEQCRAALNRISTLENPADDEGIKNGLEILDLCKQYAQDLGYIDLEDYFITVLTEYEEMVNKDSSSGVCASIKLQISQTMTMTRQAFLGTLTVENGHETTAMTDVKLNLIVTNEDGDVATAHEFQINPTSLDGFTGELDFTSGWTLAAKEKGTATVTFIPTKYAAPEEDMKWTFGGTISYTNPFTGSTLTRDLFPVTLTVRPAPELDLTYFMQRDLMGDNALTKEVIEPSVPGEFALLINNKGNGAATKVNIVTKQPEIIENEKGLLIDFEILSSTVNGKDKTLALGSSVASDFGDIPAKGQAYAQWELQTDLLGHFIDYEVSATHVTSYDNPDLSLLDRVTIHEMIHSVRIPGATSEDTLVGWLVNDIADIKDTPDAIYFSNATVENVNALADDFVTTTKQAANRYSIKVIPELEGWTYCNIQDPVLGRGKIVKVTRQSDNSEVSLHNFWQTEWTIYDAAEPLQEYRLHFADNMTLSGEEYIVEYEPLPEVQLAVQKMSGPNKDLDIEVEALTKVQVQFNKEIDPATFTADDLSMRCQGKNVDLSTVSFSTDDNRNFTLDMGTSTMTDGYYVLKVATNNITDSENYQGRNGESLDWIQYIGGLVKLTAETLPKLSGDVQISYVVEPEEQPEVVGTNRKNLTKALIDALSVGETVTGSGILAVPYGQDVLLTATPAEGYAFSGWYLGDECVGTESELVTQCLDHTQIKAQFHELNAYLTLDYNANGGTVTGGGTGAYPTGKTLALRALPTDGYVFTGWVENNEIVSTDERLSLTLSGSRNLRAEFVLIGGRAGDVNVDKFINVSDVTAMVDLILEKDEGNFSVVYSDVNDDAVVNVNDVTSLIELLFSGSATSKKTYSFLPRQYEDQHLAFSMENMEMLQGETADSKLSFDGVFNFNCFQFDLDAPDGFSIENVLQTATLTDHRMAWNQLRNGSVRILCYSMPNKNMQRGELAEIALRVGEEVQDGNYALTMKNIILGRLDGSSVNLADKQIKVCVGDGVVGIDEVEVSSERSDVYDLQGRKIDADTDLVRGIYIINGEKTFVK